MGRIVATEFVSVDGVMQAPGGDEKEFKYSGWTFKFDRGDDGNKFKLDETMDTEALLLGRITYEGFSKAWPTVEGEFADKFNSMPKYVVSSTLTETTWNNSHIITGDFKTEITKLKQEIAGNLVVHGSATLVRGLIENDLLDEIRLMIFPVILGQGKKLFGDTTDSKNFTLASTQTVGDGIVILTYQASR